jgi:hypothetical protein
MLCSLLISHRSASPTTSRAHVVLRGPFLPSIARAAITPTHAHRRAVHITSAHARPQPHPIRLARLQSRISAPACGLVGFSRSHRRSVLDRRARLGSGRRCMDVIQRPRRIRAWRYDHRRRFFCPSTLTHISSADA